MVVLIEGGSGDTEVQAVIDELNDPLWEEVEGFEAFGRQNLVELARTEIAAYIEARSKHATAIEPLIKGATLLTLE